MKQITVCWYVSDYARVCKMLTGSNADIRKQGDKLAKKHSLLVDDIGSTWGLRPWKEYKTIHLT